eukprot:2698573-Heterocapsa_arctica.AAC.1
MPVSWLERRLRHSTAAHESMPASMRSLLGSTVARLVTSMAAVIPRACTCAGLMDRPAPRAWVPGPAFATPFSSLKRE